MIVELVVRHPCSGVKHTEPQTAPDGPALDKSVFTFTRSASVDVVLWSHFVDPQSLVLSASVL